MEPIINSQLPEFKVQAFQNGSFKTVTNEDVKGKWAIFFFYPADFTFVCPTELVDIAEKYDQFQAMGVEVYSVSTDSHFVHKAWHDASESIRKIKYPMLAEHFTESWLQEDEAVNGNKYSLYRVDSYDHRLEIEKFRVWPCFLI